MAAMLNFGSDSHQPLSLLSAATLDFSTARTIATFLIHSKLDYCNSLFLNLPQSQLDGRL